MKTKLRLLALLGIVLLHTPAAWADDFYVIAEGRGVGTRITSVPYEIKNPGFYYLGGNLTYSGTGNAITVSADDVTLDLMGFSLTKSGLKGNTRGIYMSIRHNVEIRNGTVRGFDYGVCEASSSGTMHRAVNVRATGNNVGINFNGSNHLIKGCNASNNSVTGLELTSGLITDCVACNNADGILFQGPGNVLGNSAFNNSSCNFALGNGIATAIMVDRNSAFGLTINYLVLPGTSGVVGLDPGTKMNAGAP
jgi:hypothetical protein